MNRLIVSRLLLGVCLLIGVSTVVLGDNGDGDDQFQIRLTGFQENPSISTTGRGRLTLEIQDDAERIEFRLRYSDLEGGAVGAAHIHLGALHTNGGVVAFLCGGGGKAACPSPAGDVNGTITAADIVGPAGQGIAAGEATAFEEFVRAIRAGYTYANVHTTAFPGGEIRGQIGAPGNDRD
jgi:hypothetical protein